MKSYLFLLLGVFALTACGGQSQTQTHTELTAQQQEILQRLNPEQQEILNQMYPLSKALEACIEENAIKILAKKPACVAEFQKVDEIGKKARNSGISEKDLVIFIQGFQ